MKIKVIFHSIEVKDQSIQNIVAKMFDIRTQSQILKHPCMILWLGMLTRHMGIRSYQFNPLVSYKVWEQRHLWEVCSWTNIGIYIYTYIYIYIWYNNTLIMVLVIPSEGFWDCMAVLSDARAPHISLFICFYSEVINMKASAVKKDDFSFLSTYKRIYWFKDMTPCLKK